MLELKSCLVLSSLLSTYAPISKLLKPKVVAGVCASQETMMQMLSKIMESLNKLELKQAKVNLVDLEWFNLCRTWFLILSITYINLLHFHFCIAEKNNRLIMYVHLTCRSIQYH